MTQTNPLLLDGELPAFAAITPEHVAPALDAALARHQQWMTEIKDPSAAGDFERVVVAKGRADLLLERVLGPVGHLQGVADTEALRAAYMEARAKVTDYALALGQDETLYAALRSVAEAPGFTDAPEARQRLVEHSLREFIYAGVALGAEDRETFKANGVELSELSNAFSNAVLDATAAWTLNLTDAARLDGLSPSDLALLAAYASAQGQDGWTITLHQPSVQAILTYAHDRDLRQTVYRAYHTRASDQADNTEFDNSGRIQRLLELRHQRAKLLGFDSAAALSIDPKMARSPEEVLAFLRDLGARARPKAQGELEALQAFAERELGLTDLKPWDVAYVSEKLRLAEYALDENAIRAYFPADAAVSGALKLFGKLFGIAFTPRDGVETWHPDVRFYDLRRSDGEVFASVFLDLYARSGKRGGAWMDVCRSRVIEADGLHRPVAYLVCNFAPPTADAPSLLTHRDVLTLLHEFGHGLHHLLTQVDLPAIGGINGFEWDAVELPSQLMENFAWSREGLSLLSGHYQTGETLPDDLFDRMLAARRFQAGLTLVRQLEFALFDLRLHHEYDPAKGADVLGLLEQVRDEVSVIRPPAWHRFPHAFSHIFAGGYDAGYYSYLWAELLAADAFDRFEAEGTVNPEVGDAFRREILAVGASRPALKSFVAFRGREPKIDALLRRYGLAA